MSPLQLVEAVIAAIIAGAVNSVSGGGTLITFPVLVLCMPSTIANATSTIALWPGVIGSMGGYRGELRESGRWALMILGPCLVGGVLGAFLLIRTKPRAFDHIAPFLVLAATLLFMSHSLVARFLRSRAGEGAKEPELTRPRMAAYVAFQFAVSIYGGYFGAGIGILMLAALGIMGLTDIHRMNGLKVWAAFVTNGVAVLVFATHHMVNWPVGLSMAAGSVVGGYAGARLARRVSQKTVRLIIIFVGLAATLSLLLHNL